MAGYLVVTLGYSLEFGGRDAFIDELYIAEDHRNEGLGGEAMRIAEEYCRAVGVRALHLEVERHRTAARELYRRRGFADLGRFLLTKRLDPRGEGDATTEDPQMPALPSAGTGSDSPD